MSETIQKGILGSLLRMTFRDFQIRIRTNNLFAPLNTFLRLNFQFAVSKLNKIIKYF